MPPMDDLAKRLEMPHLEEVRAAVDQRQKEPEPVDGRKERSFTFHLRHTDGRGKVWEGHFTNKIVNLQQQSAIGAMQARLAGGVPFDALSPLTRELNLMLAHLTYSLSEKPTWAKNLGDLDDFELLQKVFEEVDLHEATFHGRSEPAKTGSEAG